MNEPFDRLEAELAGLQPLNPSPNLRQQIASELETETAPLLSSQLARWTPPFALLVAACLLIALVLRPSTQVNPPNFLPAPLQPYLSNAFDDALPSVWSYRRALLESPLAAETLLDRHAALAPRQRSSSSPVFIRSHFEPLLHGEL
jgi:hypothetical protein